MLGRRRGEQTTNSMDCLATLANETWHVSLVGPGGEDILPFDRVVNNEDLVRMAGEATEGEIKEFLHEPRNER